MPMEPYELIKRAKHTADLCDADGFFGTAQSLRALAEAIQDSNWLIETLHDAKMQQVRPTHQQAYPQD